MHLSHSVMLERMLHADAHYNGRFVTAVRTTGIYCLPGCRARKPRPENVEFFDTPDAARVAGYRACKRCHPDDFYRGVDADVALIERLAAMVRQRPGDFRDSRAMGRAAAVGQTRLNTLFRDHFHTTPAEFLVRARVALVQQALLDSATSITTIAHAAGFASLSAFNACFRRYAGLAPSAYRRIPIAGEFTLRLPSGYPLARVLRQLGRDSFSRSDRCTSGIWQSALRLAEGGAAVVETTFRGAAVVCRVLAPAPLSATASAAAHAHVVAALGLGCPLERFEQQALTTPAGATLVMGQRGLPLLLVADHFDALCWAITGQQINLAFAYRLRQRLLERCGQPTALDLVAPPAPADVAALSEDDLAALGYSRAKATYLRTAALAVLDGSLPLATLAQQAFSRREQALLAVRGIGPWSAHYVLMRSYGLLDCVPLGDTGLTAGLQELFGLMQRPSRAETLALLEPLRPFRSLATLHLWQRRMPPLEESAYS